MILESRKTNHVANTVTVTCSETDNCFLISSPPHRSYQGKKTTTTKNSAGMQKKRSCTQLAFGTDRTLD